MCGSTATMGKIANSSSTPRRGRHSQSEPLGAPCPPNSGGSAQRSSLASGHDSVCRRPGSALAWMGSGWHPRSPDPRSPPGSPALWERCCRQVHSWAGEPRRRIQRPRSFVCARRFGGALSASRAQRLASCQDRLVWGRGQSGGRSGSQMTGVCPECPLAVDPPGCCADWCAGGHASLRVSSAFRRSFLYFGAARPLSWGLFGHLGSARCHFESLLGSPRPRRCRSAKVWLLGGLMSLSRRSRSMSVYKLGPASRGK